MLSFIELTNKSGEKTLYNTNSIDRIFEKDGQVFVYFSKDTSNSISYLQATESYSEIKSLLLK